MQLTNRYILGSWEIKDNTNIDSQFLGGKVLGLLKIPANWTLPFIVLTKNFYDAWFECKSTHEVLQIIAPEDRRVFNNFFDSIELKEDILIRSNSPFEDLTHRGTYHSIAVNNETKSIEIGIHKILSSATPKPMYIVIQKCISPGETGHMSNERRITANPNRWRVEFQDSSSPLYIKAKPEVIIKELYAKKDKQILTCLRQVAGYLNSLKKDDSRYHCEWVFDGHRLWIVQVDNATNMKGRDSSATPIIEKECLPVPKKKSFRIFTSFTETKPETWKKLRAPFEFQNLDFPFANVYLLLGKEWSNPSQNIREEIKKDLQLMTSEHPIIIRCDISKEVKKEDLFLPTSPAITIVSDAISFMKETSIYFEKHEIPTHSWTFLISYQYFVKASALVHSYPGAQRIRIDSLWGYPDGLSYYPHETCFYYTNGRKPIRKNNYKSVCLFPTDKGWKPYKLDAPYDWHHILTDSEIETLSSWALQLANSLGKEVQLMVFTKLGKEEGTKGCLPWHFTDLPVKPYNDSLKTLPDLSDIVTIKDWNDLNRLEEREEDYIVNGILIMPAENMLRNEDFIRKTATYSAKNKLPLYFQGSLLGHAYYLMTKEGANVIPITQDEPKDSGISYNKLVRDKIPMIIQQAGGVPRVRKLDKSMAIKLLSQKIIEEAFEVWNSNNENELLQEIADVIEVLDALIKSSNLDKQELEKIKNKKIKKRGGFEELIFLEATAIRSLKAIDNSNGLLPLFMQDDLRYITPNINLKKTINFIAEKNSQKHVHFSIPLVPQIDNQLKIKTIEDNNGEYKVKANYNGNMLDIQVFKIEKKTQTHPEATQLSLF